ncbi:hypothetical protein BSPWISOXPB_7666 [uncultured Gammaproteobacteria bacterium]|nr:hypothetical protein BSPWISOXPB_7666 [uncultured Gammaproteobacteria bacterium]
MSEIIKNGEYNDLIYALKIPDSIRPNQGGCLR